MDTGFKRVRAGCYIERLTRAVVEKNEAEGCWEVRLGEHSGCAFYTAQWDVPSISFVITGFRSMHEARSFDFISLFTRTGKPSRNSLGKVTSIPVRGVGAVQYCACLRVSELLFSQQQMDLFPG